MSFTEEGMRLADNYRSEWVNSKLTTQDRREALRSHLQAMEDRCAEKDKVIAASLETLGQAIGCIQDIAIREKFGEIGKGSPT